MANMSSEQLRVRFQGVLLWTFWIGYVVFPMSSGTWFVDRLECVYPWSELVKNSLSAAAYLYLGFFVYGLTQSKDERRELSVLGLVLAVLFGAMMGFGVWEKCF